ncbi:MAG: DUF3084 domain-containing protein [Armatimonadota bacterium]
MPITLVVGIIVVLLSGFIAYLGDWLGRTLGRRKLSIWGFRPRYTAMIVTAITGALISVLSWGIILGSVAEFRDIIFRGEQTFKLLKQTETKYTKLSTRYKQITSELSNINVKLSAQTEKLRNNGILLKKQIDMLANANKELSLRNEQISKLKGTEIQLNSQIRSQQQRLGQLAIRNKMLVAESEELKRAATKLKASSDFLMAQNTRFLESNRLSSKQNIETQSKNIELEARNKELSDQDQKLRSEGKELAVRSAELQSQLKELDDTIAALTKQETQLRQAVNTLIDKTSSPLVFERGQEVFRRIIDNKIGVKRIRQELQRLLVEAGWSAEARGAAKSDSWRAAYMPVKKITMTTPDQKSSELVADEWESIRALSMQIATSSDPVLVVASSIRNSYAGEPVPIELVPYRNQLVFKSGQEIARMKLFTGVNAGVLSNQIVQFLLTEVKSRAVQAGLLPVIGSAGSSSVGDLPNEDLAEMVQQLKYSGLARKAEISFTAKKDTYTGDELRIRLRLVP